MTFVAQPYERFVDDLLTAITGGVIREEHRFIGSSELYFLTSPGVIPLTVKVFGEHQETFRLFEGGIDYIYDSSEEAIRWNTEAKIPDDFTYFYVNYYLQEGARKLTDRNPGSVVAILSEAFAREYAVLHKQMDLIYRSAFVDFATGSSLDHIAALLGISRKDARFASGEVLFKRSTPAEGDITISAGTVVSTATGQNFETSEKRILRKGQLSVFVPIRAQFEGPDGSADKGSIQSINRPIFGIESVLNEESTFFATEKESDEEFRRRIKGALERAGKSTISAIKYGLIEEVPGLNDGNIEITEDAEIPGKVLVRFGLAGGIDEEFVRRVEESIFNSRPAGVRVTHNLPSRSGSDSQKRVQAQITRQEARSRLQSQRSAQSLAPEILQQLPEGILPLRILVFLQLAEKNISIPEKEKIQENVRTQIVQYVDSLPMGAPLIYNKLLGAIVRSDEVMDAALVLGSDLGEEALSANLATGGRKATVEPFDIFVGLMDETVKIDVLIQLEPKDPNNIQAAVDDSLKTLLEDAMRSVLARQEGKISRNDLRTEISAVLASASEVLQLVAGEAIVMNAEYVETGRKTNNGEQFEFEVHEVPELGELRIEIPGALNG